MTVAVSQVLSGGQWQRLQSGHSRYSFHQRLESALNQFERLEGLPGFVSLSCDDKERVGLPDFVGQTKTYTRMEIDSCY